MGGVPEAWLRAPGSLTPQKIWLHHQAPPLARCSPPTEREGLQMERPVLWRPSQFRNVPSAPELETGECTALHPHGLWGLCSAVPHPPSYNSWVPGAVPNSKRKKKPLPHPAGGAPGTGGKALGSSPRLYIGAPWMWTVECLPSPSGAWAGPGELCVGCTDGFPWRAGALRMGDAGSLGHPPMWFPAPSPLLQNPRPHQAQFLSHHLPARALPV